MRRVRRTALVVGAVVLLTAGCGDPRASTAPSVERPTADRFGAPAVPRQLDVAGVAVDPCRSLFSERELEKMRAVDSSPDEFLGARGCTWTVRDIDKLSISVHAERDLLADTYRAHLDPVFVPSTVEGFPAVRQKTGRGQLNICTVTTGVADRAALDAVWVAAGDLRPDNDACEFAEQATALVIRKLPPKR
jgi:hypothetical protein